MTILITGAAGFIGFHITKRLLREGFEVVGMDNLSPYYDLRLKKARLQELEDFSKKLSVKFFFFKDDLENKNFLTELFRKYKFNKVVNLAAQAGVRHSIENHSSYINSNIVGFANLLEVCRRNDIENLIYASSSSVYGGNKRLPFSEEHNVDHPVSLYAASKKANELMAHSYSHLYGIPTTGLRFFTVYGPWGRPDMSLFLFTKSILKGEPIQIFNKGEMIRDFTFIDDITESLFRVINKEANSDSNFDYLQPSPSSSWAPYKIFNIGNSNPINLMDFISTIEEIIGRKAKKEFLDMHPGDVASTSADTELLENWIGFKPRTSVKEGIKKFIDWYTDFYDIKY